MAYTLKYDDDLGLAWPYGDRLCGEKWMELVQIRVSLQISVIAVVALHDILPERNFFKLLLLLLLSLSSSPSYIVVHIKIITNSHVVHLFP
jgi:hypothetical protein